MDSNSVNTAAQLLVEARRQRIGRSPLPEDLQPKTIADGHAIQDATVALLNETIGGWKVGLDKDGVLSRAPIFKDVILTNPAHVPASTMPLLGIESEIAFRFLKDMPARAQDYSRGDVEDAMEALPAIELLNSRYAEPGKRSTLEKLADCITQGGLVCGKPRADWRSIDFSKQDVTLTVDGKEIARRTGSHPTGDPVPPVVALVNALRKTSGIKAGLIVTAGTWTGVNYASPTSLAVASFNGFEAVSVQFTA
jgi:2-keto-4-pentenoate hydratase